MFRLDDGVSAPDDYNFWWTARSYRLTCVLLTELNWWVNNIIGLGYIMMHTMYMYHNIYLCVYLNSEGKKQSYLPLKWIIPWYLLQRHAFCFVFIYLLFFFVDRCLVKSVSDRCITLNFLITFYSIVRKYGLINIRKLQGMYHLVFLSHNVFVSFGEV